MGRKALLNEAQQAELRATLAEAAMLRKRIAADKARLAQLKTAALAKKYGVDPRIIVRILFGEPYVKPKGPPYRTPKVSTSACPQRRGQEVRAAVRRRDGGRGALCGRRIASDVQTMFGAAE